MEAITCPLCGTDLSLYGDRGRERHVNFCADLRSSPRNADSAPQIDGLPAPAECGICGRDLSGLSIAARESHANRCVDSTVPDIPRRPPPRRRAARRGRDGVVGGDPAARASDSSRPPGVPLCEKVHRLLTLTGLTRYSRRFAEEEVDMEALLLFGDEEWNALKLPMGARRRIEDALIGAEFLDQDNPAQLSRTPTVQTLPESAGSSPRREGPRINIRSGRSGASPPEKEEFRATQPLGESNLGVSSSRRVRRLLDRDDDDEDEDIGNDNLEDCRDESSTGDIQRCEALPARHSTEREQGVEPGEVALSSSCNSVKKDCRPLEEKQAHRGFTQLEDLLMAHDEEDFGGDHELSQKSGDMHQSTSPRQECPETSGGERCEIAAEKSGNDSRNVSPGTIPGNSLSCLLPTVSAPKPHGLSLEKSGLACSGACHTTPVHAKDSASEAVSGCPSDPRGPGSRSDPRNLTFRSTPDVIQISPEDEAKKQKTVLRPSAAHADVVFDLSPDETGEKAKVDSDCLSAVGCEPCSEACRGLDAPVSAPEGEAVDAVGESSEGTMDLTKQSPPSWEGIRRSRGSTALEPSSNIAGLVCPHKSVSQIEEWQSKAISEEMERHAEALRAIKSAGRRALEAIGDYVRDDNAEQSAALEARGKNTLSPTRSSSSSSDVLGKRRTWTTSATCPRSTSSSHEEEVSQARLDSSENEDDVMDLTQRSSDEDENDSAVANQVRERVPEGPDASVNGDRTSKVSNPSKKSKKSRLAKPPVASDLDLLEVVRRNADMYDKMLALEPVRVDAVMNLVKQAGFRISIVKLVNFLDRQGVSYIAIAKETSTNQKEYLKGLNSQV